MRELSFGALIPLVLFLVYSAYSFQNAPIILGASILFFLCSLFMKLVQEKWWTKSRYLLLAFFMIGLTLVLHFGWGVSDEIFMYLLIYVSATAPLAFSRLAIFVAVCAMLTMLAISFDKAYVLLLPLIAFYMGVRRSFMRRQEYKHNRQQLEEIDAAHRELQQAHEELQEETVHAMRYAALEERVRLAREIHDGLGHRLTSLIIQLQTMEIMLPGDPHKAAAALPDVMENARQALAEVRTSVREWAENESGLGLAAMRGLISQCMANSRLQIAFSHDGQLVDCPVEVSVALYRILQESLTNIMRHADATEVEVRLREEEHQVTLMVADNGCYTAETALTPGFGMQGMGGRCRALGGSCAFAPRAPRGLLVTAQLPFAPERAD